ncbi:hypothetical protein D3C87_2067840 [compost metagenome]
MALAAPLAGRQAHQVDAELVKTGRVAQGPPPAIAAGRVVRRRIIGPDMKRRGVDIDLGHGDPWKKLAGFASGGR